MAIGKLHRCQERVNLLCPSGAQKCKLIINQEKRQLLLSQPLVLFHLYFPAPAMSFQKLVLVNPSKDLSLSIYAVTYIIIPGPIHPLPCHHLPPYYSVSFD